MKFGAHSTLSTISLVSILLFSGCGFKQAKLDAEAMLDQHFRSEASGDTNAVLADYGPAFFRKITAKEWSRNVAKVGDKLGTCQSHTVTGWRVFKDSSTSGSGTTVSLQCDVLYSKHPATETFLLFKGSSDPSYKIVGHQINSSGLLAD